MAKEKTASQIDVFIEDGMTEDKKQRIKSLLKIPYKGSKTNKSLRVFSKNDEQKFYASVRVGTLIQTNDGYECNVTGKETDLVGNRFELMEVGTKEIVLTGKIIELKAEATVVDLPKAANK